MKMLVMLVPTLAIALPSVAQTQIGIVFPQSKDVYAGVPIEIRILANDIACTELKAKTTLGTLTPLGNCRYRFRSDSLLMYDPVTGSGNPEISVYRGEVKAGKVIDRIEVKVKSRSEIRPYTVFGSGGYGGRIPVSDLVGRRGVFAQIEGFDRAPDPVQSFALTTLKNDGTWKKWSQVGAHFTEEMKKALQEMLPGDRIVISSVRYQMPDSEIVDLNGIDLEVY